MKLEFRAPAEVEPASAGELLRRAWSGATPEQVKRAFSANNVRINGRVSRNPEKLIDEEALFIAEVEAPEAALAYGEAPELGRGDGWVVVEKPVGLTGVIDHEDPLNPILSFADMLGVARDGFSPVWPMPLESGGPWLIGLSPGAARDLHSAWHRGDLMITWVALVPTPPTPQGRFLSAEGIPVDYSATQIRGGVAEIQLTPMLTADIKLAPEDPTNWLLDLLAAQDLAALGDARRGGFMVPGAVRMQVAAFFYTGEGGEQGAGRAGSELAHSWNPGPDWWPEGAVVWAAEEERAAGGAASGRAQRSGGRKVARDESVDILVDEAIARRAALVRQSQTTDLFRLIHGKADGFPGLYLDRVGPLLRATLFEESASAFSEQVYQNILDFDPETMILEVEHLRDIRAEGGSVRRDRQARVVEQGPRFIRDGERIIGVEDGLKYWCEPWEGIDVGFFADQRENRRRLRQFARPAQRWLNLFCHTGAFSVVLAKLGCEVVSVDLSKRYLGWLEENLELNRLPTQLNRSVADDARAFLDGYKSLNSTPYDGIIVDPPTAARGSAGFWSVKKDYEDLLIRCFERLAPGGVMLVCRNDKRPVEGLDSLVRRAAERAGRGLKSLDDAPPAPDYPRLAGFPEGDSFEGVWARALD